MDYTIPIQRSGPTVVAKRRQDWTAEAMAARAKEAAERNARQVIDDILSGKYPKITDVLERIKTLSDAGEFKMDLGPYYASLGNDYALLTKFLTHQGFKFDTDTERGDFTGVVRWGQ
jgi:hypothetical protein